MAWKVLRDFETTVRSFPTVGPAIFGYAIRWLRRTRRGRSESCWRLRSTRTPRRGGSATSPSAATLSSKSSSAGWRKRSVATPGSRAAFAAGGSASENLIGALWPWLAGRAKLPANDTWRLDLGLVYASEQGSLLDPEGHGPARDGPQGISEPFYPHRSTTSGARRPARGGHCRAKRTTSVARQAPPNRGLVVAPLGRDGGQWRHRPSAGISDP